MRAFRGRWGGLIYAASAAGAFSLQYLTAWGLIKIAGQPFELTPWFFVDPIRSGLTVSHHPDGLLWLWAVAAFIGVGALLTTLSLKRAEETGDYGLALTAFVPFMQILSIIYLSLRPEGPRESAETLAVRALEARAIALGLFAGLLLSLMLAAFSVWILGLYGSGLFVLTPLVIGASVGYLANSRGDVGRKTTVKLGMFSMLLSGLALIMFALEGVVCLVMASPIIIGLGVIGAHLGYWLSRRGKNGARSTLASVAVTPLLMAAELLLPPHAAFESVESVEVAAPSSAVWDAIVHMGPIADPPAAPFRRGLAYPMRGEIMGQGVGAIRLGVFSTGTAYERVTEWRPNEALYFDVLSDPPTMRELSPYDDVNAPHVQSYFRTLDAHFTITPLADGRTRLTLATHHEFDIAPGLYWLPIAKWAVHVNKTRVLRHFRRQAEGGTVSS